MPHREASYCGTATEGRVRPCPPRRPRSGAGPAPGHNALPPGPSRPRRRDRAVSRRVRAARGGVPAGPPPWAGPPQRPVTRPAGKSRDKGRKEIAGRGSAELVPSRRLLSAAPGEATARRPSRYLSGRAPLATQPGSSQRPPRFKPACAHGPAAPAHEGGAATPPWPHS